MQHLELSRALWRDFSVQDKQILSGEIGRSELAEMLETVKRKYVVGRYAKKHGERFFFPDTLYHSHWKRRARAEDSKTVGKLVEVADSHGLTLYKYRQFLPEDTENSLYRPSTIGKAKIQEAALLGQYPRIGKIERTAGRNGIFHLQGLAAMPYGISLPPDNFQKLRYSTSDTGARQFAAYLSKPADQNVERDKWGNLLHPFPLALLAVADWYVGTVENRVYRQKRNPRTLWQKGVPMG